MRKCCNIIKQEAGDQSRVLLEEKLGVAKRMFVDVFGVSGGHALVEVMAAVLRPLYTLESSAGSAVLLAATRGTPIKT